MNSNEKFPCPNPRFRIIYGEYRMLDRFTVSPDSMEFNKILKIKNRACQSNSANQLLTEAEALAKDLIRPRAVYAVFKIDPETALWFPGAVAFYLAAVTIGPELEEKLDQMNQSGQIAMGTVLDALGSVWVEASVNALDQTISLEASILKLKRGRRRSPGYKPWSLSTQKRLFEMLPVENLGITLSSAYIMKPRKSVTFGVSLSIESDPRP